MKIDKLFLHKYFKKNLDKISNLLKSSLVSPKKKVNPKKVKSLSKTKKKFSLINKISKSEKYQNIIEKFSQFKKDELKKQKPKNKNSSKKQTRASLISNFSKSKIKYKFTNYYLSIIAKKESFIKTFNKLKLFKNFNLKPSKKEKVSNKKFDQKIGVIFYGDHNLIFISLILNLNNNIKIEGITEIPIPGNVIGDSVIEDTNELANILLDSLNLLELNTSPLLVVLSSSFFNIHTFQASDLKQISQTDSKIQSKSPYLPVNTLVDFLRMSDPKISNSLIRTIYSKKEFINGWTNTLEIIDLPIIGIVPASPNIFDSITEKVIEETTVLIDIESASTTVLIGSKLAELASHKLPFGSSLYLSNDLENSSIEYFDRVMNSIKLILKDKDKKLPSNIFVMGSGLDKLIRRDLSLPNGFKSISELKLTEFSYTPKSMKIHELISNSIDSNLYSLSTILSLCV